MVAVALPEAGLVGRRELDPRSHLALFQKYCPASPGAAASRAPPSSGSPSACVASSACRRAGTRRHVGREALLGVRDRKPRARLRPDEARARASGCPRRSVSNFDQRVTQWMSRVCSVAGQRVQLVPQSEIGFSTRPETSKVPGLQGRSTGPSQRAAPATSRSGTGRAAGGPGRSRPRAPSFPPSTGTPSLQ